MSSPQDYASLSFNFIFGTTLICMCLAHKSRFQMHAKQTVNLAENNAKANECYTNARSFTETKPTKFEIYGCTNNRVVKKRFLKISCGQTSIHIEMEVIF